jgi:hypothetical protein
VPAAAAGLAGLLALAGSGLLRTPSAAEPVGSGLHR